MSINRRLFFVLITGCLTVSSVSADTFHGMNAGAVIWNDVIQLTPQKAGAIAATGTDALRVNFRLDGHAAWDAAILAQYDQIIQNATNAGLEVLGLWSNETVAAGQSVWNDDPGGSGINGYVSDFAQNALILADRYKDTIKVWEVTNEPNSWSINPATNDPRFVGGTYILPQVYANILAETYKELNFYNSRSILDDHGIRLMTGGLLAHDIGGGFSTAMPYMQDVYDQDHVWSAFQSDTGETYPWDLFGYHFYISQGNLLNPSQLNNYFNAVRNTQAANGDGSDISVTEWGWQTLGSNTQELQRDNMATAYDLMESKPYIESTYWYQWLDEAAGNWGVNTISGTPKLSHAEFVARNVFVPSTPGDFDDDGDIDADDIDLLYDNFGVATFDLTGDGQTNNLDVIELVNVILATEFGDADLDGDVDLDDFNLLAANFNLDGGWSGGDFTGNHIVDLSDFNLLASSFGFDLLGGGEEIASLVPTPAPAAPITLALLLLGGRAASGRSTRH